jgi:hypothetical protein
LTDVSEGAAASIRGMALMIEAESTSETSAVFYQTTRRNKPEDGHLLAFSSREEFLMENIPSATIHLPNHLTDLN